MKLTTYNQKIDKFLADTIKACNRYDVEFICSLKSFVRENKQELKSAGYFDGENQKLACSFMGTQKSWLKTLLHESCHLDQWAEKSKLWEENSVYNDIDWDGWIQGLLEYPPEAINACLDSTKILEMDCEKRVIEKIKKYNLPVDIKEYSKGANAYVLYYDFVKKYRTWKPKIYKNKKLLALMPDVITDNLVLTPEIEKEMK